MKISIDRKTLSSALGIVKAAASSKPSLPILANVAIGTFEKSVDFTCTDLDLTIRVKAEAVVVNKTAASKDFTVRVGLLHDLVKSFTGEDPVELEVFKNSVRIKCGVSNYSLGTLDIDDFPATPRVGAIAEFKIPQSVMRSLLTSTAYCSHTADQQRPILCGSLFKVNGNLTTVGCDGRRLALMSAELDDDKIKPADVIVPRSAISELLPLLENDEDKKITTAIGEKLVQFTFGDITLISKIIDGKYPDYKKIIPKLEGDGVPIGRADLLNALRRVHFIGDTCSLEFRGQTLTIKSASTHSGITGDAMESLLIPKTPEMSARFNTEFLAEALASVDDDEVLFFGQSDGPSVFKVKTKPWLSITACISELKGAKPGSAAVPAAASKTPEPAAK